MAMVLANTTPGGPVSPEDYAGEGVRFAAGASLIQDATALADTSRMTISLWMRCHTPPVATQFNTMFLITKFNEGEGSDYEENFYLGVSSIRPGTASSIDMETKSYDGIGAFVAGDGATNYDQDPLTEDGEWHHVFMTVDTTGVNPAWLLYVDGEVSTLTNTAHSGYPTAMTFSGRNIGFPVSSDLLNHPDNFGGWGAYPADFSDVQIWFDQAIDPTATKTHYSAKAGVSNVIRDLVNYMNSRGVSPVDALAVMKLESQYGALSRNYFQFLQQGAFNSILGYTGRTTNNTDLNRAFANAWLGFRPDGSVVGAPNNYDRQVRNVTEDEPLGWQKYLIHNLGGSTGVTSQVNGHNLLQAWADDDEQTLGEVAASVSNMVAQTKIWGSTGPIGEVTTSTTVAQAVNALILVYEAHAVDAITRLDASSISNLSYFIDDDGFAVPPAAATDKFGLQTFLFTGSEEDFIFNRGSGGDVTLIGEVATVAGPND